MEEMMEEPPAQSNRKNLTREDQEKLRDEILQFKSENPDKTNLEIAAHFGIKIWNLNRYLKTGGGTTRKPKKQKPAPKSEALTTGVSLTEIGKKLREIADMCDHAVENLRKKAEELFF